jgi:hypothetical protein
MVSSPGKKLSGNEMKNLTGGAVKAASKVWVCIFDGVTCYAVKYDCYASCDKPWNCISFTDCPYE